MRVQNVWHVSYLKAYKSDGGRPPSPLPEMIGGELEFEVDSPEPQDKKARQETSD